MAEKKYAEAILEYRNAIKQDGKFAEARMKLADAYVATGDNRNALREAVRAADLLTDSVDAQLRAGTLLLAAGQYADARARAVAALEKEPKNPQALVMLGSALAAIKDLDGAIKYVQEAVDQAPHLTLTYENLGALYALKGDR